MARLRSPNGFGLESHTWFSFKDHPTLSAYTPKLHLRVVNISIVSGQLQPDLPIMDWLNIIQDTCLLAEASFNVFAK